MNEKRSLTTKDIALLHQLYDQGQITLAPEFQRNSIWPRTAKAYLIDTILSQRPIPLLYFRRGASAQTGKSRYEVIDGQQRLRAVFEFMDDRFPLSESKDPQYKGKRYSELGSSLQERILSYDLYIQELVGHSDDDIRDIFVRMNKYVVKLSGQEIRHAKHEGKFKEFVEDLGAWAFWTNNRVFTAHQIRRMRNVEFSAELTILLLEGPQDKKQTIDLYYVQFAKSFGHRADVRRRLGRYLKWIAKAIPDLSQTRYRKPVDLYSLVGALKDIAEHPFRLSDIDPAP